MSVRLCDYCGCTAKYECAACDGKAAYCGEEHQKIDYDERHCEECIEGLSLRKFIPFKSDFQHALPDLFVAILKLRKNRNSPSNQQHVTKQKNRLLVSMKRAHMYDTEPWGVINKNIDEMIDAEEGDMREHVSAIFSALLNVMPAAHPGRDHLKGSLESDSKGMSDALAKNDERSVKQIAKNRGEQMDRRHR